MQPTLFGEDNEQLANALIHAMGYTAVMYKTIVQSFIRDHVAMAELIGAHAPEHVIEVACGAGVPSLALKVMGVKEVTAFDIDPKQVKLAQTVSDSMGIKVTYEQSDFYYWSGEVNPGSFIVANHPWGTQNCAKLGHDIVNFAIDNRCHLAFVPAYADGTTPEDIDSRCKKLAKRLFQNHYTVSQYKLGDMERLLIAELTWESPYDPPSKS